MKESFCESERKRLDKMNKFQLAHRFKRIGWVIVIIAFVLMIAKKFVDEPSWVKPVLTNLMIVGFLLISLAKEKVEDELIDKLRAQSYRLAFILGVVYSLVQPYVEYGVDYLFNQEKAEMGFSYFQVLIFMLLVQIMFFTNLKRQR
ncbi:hypothetical protein [Pseudotenacibaculum haliotis]|uniref:Uncharacterized protein n=1 Tax=Pseudotenacibaculum haliotis TaxID=1862138 RepID=A0ABW5LUY0_9FLAO